VIAVASTADTGGFVGRGGIKLRHALDFFGIDPAGAPCADLGCHVGGFTDCLLKAGAASVFAVDTGYGVLDYRLRVDPRVTVMERTNALHAEPPRDRAVRIVVIDLGWTPQRLCLPVAARWAATGGPGARVLTLIKPQYEAREVLGGAPPGVLEESVSWDVARAVVARIPAMGFTVLGFTRSPIQGGQTRGVRTGNTEFFALLAPTRPHDA
jgi:23S rRNA (cytidine1920-2'-O)/16S rRNA (cytidine1409-2'-O)-methyltransferase